MASNSAISVSPSASDVKTAESVSSQWQHPGAVSAEHIRSFTSSFEKNDKNSLALNVVTRTNFLDVAIDRARSIEINRAFSVRIPEEGKATNQKSSGRCWLFAVTNVMRLGVMKSLGLDSDMELSQPFLFFWDKFEKANFFLENILNTMLEKVEDRLLSYLLHAPVNDGGQFDMIVNIVEKYGVVPKSVFPETHHSGSSQHLNWIITYKLREFACTLRALHAKGKSIDELRNVKRDQLDEIFRILCIFLGQPPQTFDWSFHAKDKKHQRLGKMTPLEFAQKHISFKVSEQVSLINDPRNEYFKLYTVDYLGNVVGGRKVLYVNVPIDLLKLYARKTLELGQPVWFGCDVGKLFHRENGVMDPAYFRYDLVLGTQFTMSKADRLRYGESLMTHAMVFTAVDIVDDKPVKWRVENSWGDSGGDKGYLVMTDEWFDEYMYQIVIDRSILTPDVLCVLEQSPVHLPAWDPMGSLAN